MKIYISGKITGLDIQEAERKFDSAALHVESKGLSAINPLTILTYAPELTWQDYMKADIKALVDCDAILMLPCWEDSKGAKVEHYIANSLGLTVFYGLDDLEQSGEVSK